MDGKYTFGMIGLGTMGRNLLLNIADHGFHVAGFDKSTEQVALLEKEGYGKDVKGFTSIEDFISSLTTPRAIMMLVPAGKIVDSVIEELLPLLDKGDIIIDGGNSHYTDTVIRDKYLKEKGLHFFGMGISGGEEGARNGPSMMPGGDKAAYNVMKPVLEAVAAKVGGDPCVTYIGPGASGHFVKMVHNGIEYAIMQLLAESYELMAKTVNYNNDQIQKVFASWNAGRLNSFLMEITADIFKFKNPDTGNILVDDIKDEARAKGTGKWTSQVAFDLEAPVNTIDTSVTMRDMSKLKSLRTQTAALYPHTPQAVNVDAGKYIEDLENAFYFSMAVTYAQGMHLLSKASVAYDYDLQMDEIAKIWRGGCIIRSTFLENIYNAFKANKKLEHLLLDADVQKVIQAALPGTRAVISGTIASGIATPVLSASLSYFDTLRNERMPSNLIQAQRDYFGAHTYELIGKEGKFHTHWQTNVSDDNL